MKLFDGSDNIKGIKVLSAKEGSVLVEVQILYNSNNMDRSQTFNFFTNTLKTAPTTSLNIQKSKLSSLDLQPAPYVEKGEDDDVVVIVVPIVVVVVVLVVLIVAMYFVLKKKKEGRGSSKVGVESSGDVRMESLPVHKGIIRFQNLIPFFLSVPQ